MRALSLLKIARMSNLGLTVVRSVPLLLADERLVDLELQVRLASGVVSLHCGQPIAKRQRANVYSTYRFDPSLQDLIEKKLAAVTCLEQEGIVQPRERNARIAIKLRHVGRKVHFDVGQAITKMVQMNEGKERWLRELWRS